MANHLVNSDTHVPFREYGLPEIQQDRFVISIPEAPAALPLPELSIPIIQTVFLPRKLEVLSSMKANFPY